MIHGQQTKCPHALLHGQKLNQLKKGGALIQYDLCPYRIRERYQGCVSTEKRPCEDMVRRYPTGNQRERAALVETDPTDTLFLILDVVASGVVRKHMCGVFLWQP